MKYILKNILNFIKEECMVFILLCLSIICSVSILYAAYGIYSAVNKSLLESAYGSDDLTFNFTDSPSGYPTKGQLMAVLDSINMEILEGLDIIVADGWFPDDVEKAGYEFDFIFRYSNGKISCAEQIHTNLVQSGLWRGGSFFNQQQYQQGELVAIAGTPDSELSQLADYPYNNADEYVIVDGKRYRCIGKQSAMNTPMIPFTTVADDLVLEWVAFGAKGVMTRAEYIEITDAMHGQFPDFDIPEYPVPDAEEGMIYKSILVICVLIAVISALVYAVLYQYIIDRRKRTLDIFRVSGLTLRQAHRIYLGECLLLLLVCYGIGISIFRYFIFPKLSDIYYYMEEAFSTKTYLILGAVYLLVVYVIMRIKLIGSFQKTRMIERI